MIDYYVGVDIWSLGCIFAKMSTGTPLFARGGDNGINAQLLSIFSVLGLPNDVAWPGVVSKLRVKLKGWKNKHLNYQPQDLAQRFASLGVDGVDLLQRMLTYKPARMISARVALEHPYFAELRFMMVF
ncbi:putative protein-serine/threonine kinase CMGC-CDK-Pl family [Helianthus annuus]|nr:putative protein-serine/threonine kinase CMGC-CDK-Pl family [Helianthus annuus]